MKILPICSHSIKIKNQAGTEPAVLGSYHGSRFGGLACKGAVSCKINSDTTVLTDNHKVWTQETRRDPSRVWE